MSKNNTSNTKVTTILLGDTLVFADRVVHLEQGEGANFLPVDVEACNTEVVTLEPPIPEVTPENDPRWEPLIEGAHTALRVVMPIIETYAQESRQTFVEEWVNNVNQALNDTNQH